MTTLQPRPGRIMQTFLITAMIISDYAMISLYNVRGPSFALREH